MKSFYIFGIVIENRALIFKEKNWRGSSNAFALYSLV